MKLLLLGKNGQVGWELQRSLAPLGEVIALDRQSVNVDGNSLCGDVGDLQTLAQTIRSVRPDVIVNAAAHTAVDKAESEPDLALRLNAEAPEVMALEAKSLGALLVHYSTDYVFDGSGDAARDEEAATGTSNGALVYYLYRHGLVELDKVYTVVQGEKMGRPSMISAQVILKDGQPFVKVGGPAVTLVRGEIELAKAELLPQAKRLGFGAGLFGAAGYLALQAVTLLFICVGLTFSALYQMVIPNAWAFVLGFLTLAVLVLIVVLIQLAGNAFYRKVK